MEAQITRRTEGLLFGFVFFLTQDLLFLFLLIALSNVFVVYIQIQLYTDVCD